MTLLSLALTAEQTGQGRRLGLFNLLVIKEHLPHQKTATSIGCGSHGSERPNPQGLMLSYESHQERSRGVPRAQRRRFHASLAVTPSGQCWNCMPLPSDSSAVWSCLAWKTHPSRSQVCPSPDGAFASQYETFRSSLLPWHGERQCSRLCLCISLHLR